MTLASAAGTFIAATPITIAKGATAIATREAACLMPDFLVLAVVLILVICLYWVEEVVPPMYSPSPFSLESTSPN